MKNMKNLIEGVVIGLVCLLIVNVAAPAGAQEAQDHQQRVERDDSRDRTARRGAYPKREETPYSNSAQQRLREAQSIQRQLDRDRKPKCFRCDPPNR